MILCFPKLRFEIFIYTLYYESTLSNRQLQVLYYEKKNFKGPDVNQHRITFTRVSSNVTNSYTVMECIISM